MFYLYISYVLELLNILQDSIIVGCLWKILQNQAEILYILYIPVQVEKMQLKTGIMSQKTKNLNGK